MTKDEAMKLALEALEFIPESGSMLGTQAETKRLQAITVLREALAKQPAQQEPVAWGVDWGKAGDIPCVSIIKRLPGGGIEVVAVEYAPYEYSPPSQRTWVGLTDEEEVELWESTDSDWELMKRVEAKLKEKNNG